MAPNRPPSRSRRALLRLGLLGAALTLAALSASASINAPSLKRDVTTLSSDRFEGRCLGEPGGRRAGDYIEAEFARLGLQALSGDGYEQRFDVTLGGERGSGTAFTWGGAPLAPETDFRPLGFSAAKRVTAPIVFAGYGLAAEEQNDYDGLDVRGKVVLVLSGYPGPRGSNGHLGAMAWPRGKERVAEAQGAVGMVYVVCSTDAEPDDLEAFDRAQGRRPCGIPVVTVTRAALLRVAPAGYADLLDEKAPPADRRGEVLGDVDLRVDIRPVKAQGRNIIGLLPGADPELRWEVVAVGAHYDHVGRTHPAPRDGRVDEQICNGADDNASGTAGVLALARSLTGGAERPKRSVLFLCFDAEEEGLFGSEHYVEHPLVPLAKTAAMVNLDMIGRLRDHQLWVFSTESCPRFDPLLTSLSEPRGLRLQLGQKIPSGSDHAAFLEAGIPVAFFFTGLHGDYHTPADDWQLLNVEGEARVLGLVEAFVRTIADTRERPQFAKAAP